MGAIKNLEDRHDNGIEYETVELPYDVVENILGEVMTLKGALQRAKANVSEIHAGLTIRGGSDLDIALCESSKNAIAEALREVFGHA